VLPVLKSYLSIVVEFNLATPNPPDHSPTMTLRETPQVVIANCFEKLEFAGVSHEAFSPCRQALPDNSRHRFEMHEQIFHLWSLIFRISVSRLLR
jgi:hypothetical protein